MCPHKISCWAKCTSPCATLCLRRLRKWKEGGEKNNKLYSAEQKIPFCVGIRQAIWFVCHNLQWQASLNALDCWGRKVSPQWQNVPRGCLSQHFHVVSHPVSLFSFLFYDTAMDDLTFWCLSDKLLSVLWFERLDLNGVRQKSLWIMERYSPFVWPSDSSEGLWREPDNKYVPPHRPTQAAALWEPLDYNVHYVICSLASLSNSDISAPANLSHFNRQIQLTAAISPPLFLSGW